MNKNIFGKISKIIFTTISLFSISTFAFGAEADLQITKQGPSTANGGDYFTYTLLITNNGPDAANGAVFKDFMPTGVIDVAATCAPMSAGAVCPSVIDVINTNPSNIEVSGSLPVFPNGGQFCITITGRYPINGPASYENVATITEPSGVDDNNQLSNRSSVGTSMSYNATPVDLSITKTQSSSVYQNNATITYTIVVKNNGNSTISNAQIFDSPNVSSSGVVSIDLAGCTATTGSTCPSDSNFYSYLDPDYFNNYNLFNTLIPTLAPAGEITILYEMVAIDGSDIDNCNAGEIHISNSASVNPPPGMRNTNENYYASVAINRLRNPPCPQTDVALSIIKTQSTDTHVSGNEVTYEMRIENTSAYVLDGTLISDSPFFNYEGEVVIDYKNCVSAGGAECPAIDQFHNYPSNYYQSNYMIFNTAIPKLPPGGALIITYTMTATDPTNFNRCGRAKNEISNAFNAILPNGFLNTLGNSASVTLEIPETAACPPIDILITKNQSSTFIQGEPIRYEVIVENVGNIDSDNTVISDQLTAIAQLDYVFKKSIFISCVASINAECPSDGQFPNRDDIYYDNPALFGIIIPKLPIDGKFVITDDVLVKDIGSTCLTSDSILRNTVSASAPTGYSLVNNTPVSVEANFYCSDISVNKAINSVILNSGDETIYTIAVANGG